LKNRMVASKIAARAAVADTPGCAWAVARFGKEEIVAPGRASDLLGSLPVTALRLAPATVERLHDVGIERIAQLASKPHELADALWLRAAAVHGSSPRFSRRGADLDRPAGTAAQ
jgi:nucleotidyltransferase/DNA polymerase involved in DNA repair